MHSILTAVGTPPDPPRSSLILVVGAAFLVAGLVALWRLRRKPPPLASRWWFACSRVTFYLWGGAIFCLLFIDPAGRTFNTFVTWSLLLPAAPFVAGVVRLGLESREDRRWRLGMGMSPLRRRLAWPYVAIAWWVVSSLLVFIAFAAVYMVRLPEVTDPQAPAFMVVYLVVSFGGTAVAGFVQAWRRRARDRAIQEDTLGRSGLVDANPSPLAPAWMPRQTGNAWLQWKQSLNEPVKPGDELGVILPAAAAVVGVLFVAVLMGIGAGRSPNLVGGPLMVIVVLGAGVFVALQLLAPLGAGLGTAIRQLRARKQPPPPSQDDVLPPPDDDQG